jgi:hypothetical protein
MSHQLDDCSTNRTRDQTTHSRSLPPLTPRTRRTAATTGAAPVFGHRAPHVRANERQCAASGHQLLRSGSVGNHAEQFGASAADASGEGDELRDLAAELSLLGCAGDVDAAAGAHFDKAFVA